MAAGGLQGKRRRAKKAREGSSAKKAAKLAVFVDEYLIDFNGTRAAIRCGYAENSAHVTASRLLRDPWVKRELAQRSKERKARLKLTVERLDEELAKLAFSNLFDYVTPDGLINLEKVNRDQAAAILELKWGMAGQEPDKATEKVSDWAVSEPERKPADRLEPQPHGGALRRAAAKTRPVLTRIKLHSKTQALKMVGQRLKAYTDKVEHEGKVTVVVDL